MTSKQGSAATVCGLEPGTPPSCTREGQAYALAPSPAGARRASSTHLEAGDGARLRQQLLLLLLGLALRGHQLADHLQQGGSRGAGAA